MLLHKKVSQFITQNQQDLVNSIVNQQYNVQSSLRMRYDEYRHQKMVEDVVHNLTYLAHTLAYARPVLFADYISWLKTVLLSYDIPVEDLRGHLEAMEVVLSEGLDADAAALLQGYIQAAVNRLDQDSHGHMSFIDETVPYGTQARQYLDLLLQGKRHDATQLILDMVSSDVGVHDIYLNIFQPALHEVGRLWQINQITVAHEHFVTAATQLIMSQLYPHIFRLTSGEHRLVAACVSGELHEIGVRMVADFFEMAGWDTFYLGANVPATGIVNTIVEQKADVLALSATLLRHVADVDQIIQVVRASEAAGVSILVGGYPFNISSDLWQEIGADGYAPNAEVAIDTAVRLVNAS